MTWREGIFTHNPERSKPEDRAGEYFAKQNFKPLTNEPAPFIISVDMLFDKSNCKRIIGDWEAVAVFWDGEPHESEIKRAYDGAVSFVLERHHIKVLRFKYRGIPSNAFLEQCEAELREYVEP